MNKFTYSLLCRHRQWTSSARKAKATNVGTLAYGTQSDGWANITIMKSLISYEEFACRYSQDVLPELNDGKPEEHILQSINDATGIIVSHLSWLIDKEINDITENIPIQFESVLKTICCDIAFLRINDKVSSDEDSREKYKNAMNMLEKIDKEYKGGLSGPNMQSSFIVDESSDKDLVDNRFFKKGKLI